jgi:hypothetical protein
MSRRRAAAWLLAGVLAAAGLGLIVLPVAPPPEALAPPPQALPAALPPAQPPRAAAASPDVPAPASSATAGAALVAPWRRDHWDLCDVGRLPLPPGASPDEPPQHVFDALAAGLAPQWLAALATASDRSRAAARRLGLTADAAGGPEPVPVSMAEASADPVISAWATQGCASDAACRAAATRRWQALEPDNLAPRLWALGDGQRLDSAALQALATARRFDVHFGQLAPALLAAWPPGQPRALQVDLIVRAIGVEAAAMVSALQPLSSACREHAADAQARAACQQLARTLIRHSDTMLGVGVGLGLGRAAGLPAAETEPVRALLDQSPSVAIGVDQELAVQPWSCASHATMLAWVGETQQHGEWGALQRRLAAAPPPPR